jgi:hypothetical protein
MSIAEWGNRPATGIEAAWCEEKRKEAFKQEKTCLRAYTHRQAETMEDGCGTDVYFHQKLRKAGRIGHLS